MAEALPKNFIDYEEYPQTAEIQNRCVSMIARMFNAPTHQEDVSAMGTSTVGSSEAIVSLLQQCHRATLNSLMPRRCLVLLP